MCDTHHLQYGGGDASANHSLALRHLNEAAELGDTQAHAWLAILLASGLGNSDHSNTVDEAQVTPACLTLVSVPVLDSSPTFCACHCLTVVFPSFYAVCECVFLSVCVAKLLCGCRAFVFR